MGYEGDGEAVGVGRLDVHIYIFTKLDDVICRYKEGRVILERALVQECDGIEEHPVSD